MSIAELLTGLVLGGAISWGIASKFHRRATKELKQELAIISAEVAETETIEYFRHLLVTGSWDRIVVDGRPVWVCRERPTFQICTANDNRPFAEPWSQGFPDPNSTCFTVQLVISDAVVRQLLFVSLDGARIIVPAPERILVEQEVHFFWNPNSLSFHVGQVIGAYYVHEDIAGVAARCGVEIVNERHYGAAENRI